MPDPQPAIRKFLPSAVFFVLALLIFLHADRVSVQAAPAVPKPVREALQRSGLIPAQAPPKAMDLDGDGSAEYVGRAVTARRYDGRRLSAFYIAGKIEDEYKVLYKMIGNFEVTEESLVDFNGDHLQDYYFRYGRDGRDFGYVLLWVQPGSIKPVYQKKSPHSFSLQDLDQDGRSEIIQSAGPFAGPGDPVPAADWQWTDIFRWDAEKMAYVRDNRRFPGYFRDRKSKFEALLAQIDAQNVPGFDWAEYEESLLELRQRIETDYLKRIASITERR